MASQAPRRFWKEVSVVEGGSGLFTVALDGRTLKTPGKRDLAVASRPLAQAVAEEWAAVDKTVDPSLMPMTQLVNTMIERIGEQRAAIIDELMRYVDADALCYEAVEPADLVARQQAEWGALRGWVETRLAVLLTVTSGLMPQDQSPAVHTALRQALEAMDAATLTAFQAVAGAVGSWCAALGFVTGFADAAVIFRTALLEELFQAELWGEDWEAQDRRDALLADLLAIERFLTLSRQG